MMTIKEFAELVQKLRVAQKGYFKTRDTAYLIESKALEKIVDARVEEILTPCLFEGGNKNDDNE
jgi:hypothetical protein